MPSLSAGHEHRIIAEQLWRQHGIVGRARGRMDRCIGQARDVAQHCVGGFHQRAMSCHPGRANARPTTGSARHSIAPQKKRMDCFVALLLAMTTRRDRALRDRNVTARRANHSSRAKTCPAPRAKNISLFQKPKSVVVFAPSRPDRGAFRERHGRGAGCGGRDGDARRAALKADGEVVWSWRPDAGVKVCGFSPAKRRGQKSPVPGESAQ